MVGSPGHGQQSRLQRTRSGPEGVSLSAVADQTGVRAMGGGRADLTEHEPQLQLEQSPLQEQVLQVLGQSVRECLLWLGSGIRYA